MKCWWLWCEVCSPFGYSKIGLTLKRWMGHICITFKLTSNNGHQQQQYSLWPSSLLLYFTSLFALVTKYTNTVIICTLDILDRLNVCVCVCVCLRFLFFVCLFISLFSLSMAGNDSIYLTVEPDWVYFRCWFDRDKQRTFSIASELRKTMNINDFILTRLFFFCHLEDLFRLPSFVCTISAEYFTKRWKWVRGTTNIN